MTIMVNTMDSNMTNKSLITELEANEMEYWRLLYSVDRNNGVCPEFNTIGPFNAFRIPGIDILAYNRAITKGGDGGSFKSNINELIEYYRGKDILRFFVQLNSEADKPELRKILSDNGFSHYNDWVRHGISLNNYHEESKSGLEIKRIDRSKAVDFGSIIIKAFDMPEKLSELFISSVGKPGYRHYLVYEDGQPISAGALFIRGKFASLAIAGTHPDHRGKGAQSALILKRISEARKEGCTYLTVETARETKDIRSASFRNIQRKGFVILHYRPNFIFYF